MRNSVWCLLGEGREAVGVSLELAARHGKYSANTHWSRRIVNSWLVYFTDKADTVASLSSPTQAGHDKRPHRQNPQPPIFAATGTKRTLSRLKLIDISGSAPDDKRAKCLAPGP